MLSMKHMEEIAADMGYDDERDYATDNNLTECEDCERWGEMGKEVYPQPKGELDVEWVCLSCEKKRAISFDVSRETVKGLNDED